MIDPTWPEWVAKDVLPKMAGRIRGLQMLTDKMALVFTQESAVLAEKGLIKGVNLHEIPYPAGLILNGSHCPHCGGVILEPVGKIARLASEVESHDVAPASKKGKAWKKPRTKRNA